MVAAGADDYGGAVLHPGRQPLRIASIPRWAPWKEVDMLVQLLVGAAVSALNIIVHAAVTIVTIVVARAVAQKSKSRPVLYLAGVMITTSLLVMVAHILEVFTWSVAYAVVNAAPDDANLVYFAFVNYTTLGYGDVTPLAKWRLLGPMTAMNGVLMFGWSTALMFEVLLRTIELNPLSAVSRPDKL
jgi:hypothetical protein